MLQLDINALMNWSHEWELKFNLDKCKVMQVGMKNPNYNYYFIANGLRVGIASTEKEKIWFNRQLSISKHVVTG